MSLSSGGLWAVACHFNPCGYARRLANHRLFRERLGVPLLTIELSHDGEFELRDDDADRVLRRTCRDVLWQKERLLNLAVEALPQSCDTVAWIDADVLFERDDWAAETLERLDHDVLVQLFSRYTDLPRDVLPEHAAARGLPETGDSFAWLAARGGHDHDLFDAVWGFTFEESGHDTERADAAARVRRKRNSGFGWAARRELLTRHGLYDACILGCGDRAITCAAYGRAADSGQNWIRNARQREHFLAWAAPFAADVAGRVGCVEGHVHHLWHGELTDRRYRHRWQHDLLRDFDPFTDIAVDERGCWRWSSAKPALHAYVAEYFALRLEDGREIGVPDRRTVGSGGEAGGGRPPELVEGEPG